MTEKTIVAASSPDAEVAQLERIAQAIAEKRLPEAALALNEIIRERPGDPRIYLLGSKLAEASGHQEGMRQSAEKAVAVAPQWVVAVLHLAAVHSVQGRHEEAMQYAEKAHALAPDDPNMLRRLIPIADAANAIPTARAWLVKLDQLQPGDDHVQISLASHYAALHQPDDSIALLDQLIARHPDDPELRRRRGRNLILAGKPAQALPDAEFLLAHDPDNENYRFIAAMARGETPARQPAEMVRNTFDSYAPTFDLHLVRQLHYRLPKTLSEQILQWYPDKNFSLLDLGCGTGLLGVCLGHINGPLIGVDLSLPMLQKAAAHGVYARLHHTDLLDAVRETPDAAYDVIAACDVLIYLGDLAPVTSNAHRILRPGGRLVFSLETLPEDSAADYVLEPTTLRYRHTARYVGQLLHAAGFAQVEQADFVIRYNANQPVGGRLFTAAKAA